MSDTDWEEAAYQATMRWPADERLIFGWGFLQAMAHSGTMDGVRSVMRGIDRARNDS